MRHRRDPRPAKPARARPPRRRRRRGPNRRSRRTLPFAFDGPPPPAPPAVIARDASDRVTVRAVRLTAPLRLDGQLDEAVYTSVPPMSDFIQVEPQGGSPATEQTEVWVSFDDDHVYVVVPLQRQSTGADGRQRDAPRQQQHVLERVHRRALRYVLRPAQRVLLCNHAAWRPRRRTDHQRKAVPTAT